jgi:ABC-type multidrug transport system ATPase subunit
MGASGAGKTTLLDVIACRTIKNTEGHLKANGKEYDFELFR